ncbi:MAG: flagellar hook-associated family protein [Pseudomonadota bacterium]
MDASSISTAALRNQPRLDIQRIQSELIDRTRELSSSRHADVGLELGSGTGRMISLRNEAMLLETLMRSNQTAQARLSLTQAGLGDIRENASDVLEALISLPPGFESAELIESQGLAALDRLADRLNASDGGSFVFSGINTSQPPFTRFQDGPSAAVEAAFLARFGIPVGDPGASAITAADMTDFLNNEFAALFDDPAWANEWSDASSTDIVSRIAVAERATTGTNANEQAIRTVAEGFAMIAGLGVSALSQDTRTALITEARLRLGQATSDLARLQSEIGFAQNAIERADERMSLARDLIAETVVEAEGADPAEAKVRVDLLTTQLEMSYALTGQIARLSILNFA